MKYNKILLIYLIVLYHNFVDILYDYSEHLFTSIHLFPGLVKRKWGLQGPSMPLSHKFGSTLYRAPISTLTDQISSSLKPLTAIVIVIVITIHSISIIIIIVIIVVTIIVDVIVIDTVIVIIVFDDITMNIVYAM